MYDSFNQPEPVLGNQYIEDRVIRSYLTRNLPREILGDIEPSLREMGALAGGELYQLQLQDRLNEPRLTQWSAWGERIDEIEVSPLWQRAQVLAAEKGLVASAYENRQGRFSRLYQFALAYLFHPSTDVYTCPLAMTDGAARTLLASGNKKLIDRAVPRLTSRDPDTCWTSGQWMTESTGGSDVGRSETVARRDDHGQWRLFGRKWFTSAVTSQMSLTLARPEGNPSGSRGLALFYVETRDGEGHLNNIRVNRLKDKLGTRKVPTAELSLEGTAAELVTGDANGVRQIVPMLMLTRTWNAISAVASMRRGIALARSYASRRVAFGAPLSEQPLHIDTVAGLQAEMEAAFHLSFLLVELIGRNEAREINDEQAALLRLVNSVAKLVTAKQAVAVLSEVLESFGGAGYVEDTGLPALLRDSQVLPIWEGTTNVLALDLLRAISDVGGVAPFEARIVQAARSLRHEDLVRCGKSALETVTRIAQRLGELKKPAGQRRLEAGARRIALTLGRAMALALLCEHAQWSLDQEQDCRPLAAAKRFLGSGIDQTAKLDLDDSVLLCNDYNGAQP